MGHQQLERLKEHLREHFEVTKAEVRETGMRLISAERNLRELRRSSDDRVSREAFLAAQADLAQLRDLLAATTLERDVARGDAAECRAALRVAEASLGALHAASGSLQSAGSEAVGQVETMLPLARSSDETPVAKTPEIAELSPANVNLAGATDPSRSADDSPTLEVRLQRLEGELVTLGENLRALKNKRFEMRERLAAFESKATDPPANGDGEQAVGAERVAALRRQVRDSVTETETARTKFEALLAQRDELSRRIASRNAGLPDPTDGGGPRKSLSTESLGTPRS